MQKAGLGDLGGAFWQDLARLSETSSKSSIKAVTLLPPVALVSSAGRHQDPPRSILGMGEEPARAQMTDVGVFEPAAI
jgi:hypothetical protein